MITALRAVQTEIDHLSELVIEANKRTEEEANRAGRNGERAMKAEARLDRIKGIMADLLAELEID